MAQSHGAWNMLDPASSTVMEKNGSRTSRKCSTFGSYSGYLKPAETSWNQLKPAETSWNQLKPAETSWWIQLMLGYVGKSETSTDRSWPKTPTWIPADWFSFGVSWCFQRNSISSSDSGWSVGTPQLWDIPTWTGKPGQEQRGCIQANFKQTSFEFKRGCMRMLTTMSLC